VNKHCRFRKSHTLTLLSQLPVTIRFSSIVFVTHVTKELCPRKEPRGEHEVLMSNILAVVSSLAVYSSRNVILDAVIALCCNVAGVNDTADVEVRGWKSRLVIGRVVAQRIDDISLQKST